MPIYNLAADSHRASIEIVAGDDEETLLVVRYREPNRPETTIALPPVEVERLAWALRERALGIIERRRSA